MLFSISCFFSVETDYCLSPSRKARLPGGETVYLGPSPKAGLPGETVYLCPSPKAGLSGETVGTSNSFSSCGCLIKHFF